MRNVNSQNKLGISEVLVDFLKEYTETVFLQQIKICCANKYFATGETVSFSSG